MTISSGEALLSGPYDGDGVTSTFDYDFKIYADAELLVIRQNADGTSDELALTTDYAVGGVGDAGGGTITLVDASTVPTGSTLTIEPAITLSQERPFSTQSSTTLEQIEIALDKVTSIARQLSGAALRALRLPPETNFDEVGGGVQVGTAGDVLMWDTGGNVAVGPTATEISNAQGYATAASASADDADASAVAALAAQTATEAVLDTFDDRYLGAKASDPALDNDGDPLVTGSLYFNTTDGLMKIYNGSAWVNFGSDITLALLKANNLSDLANAATARSNLGANDAANLTAGTVAAARLPQAADAVWEAGTDTTPSLVQPAQVAAAIAALGGGGAPIVIEITSDGTWTKPATVTDTARVLVELWGGGGGGAADNSDVDGGGGGGGGYMSISVTGVDLGATEAATVGTGGAGRGTSEGNGNDGGDTTFAGLTATGGKRGTTNGTGPAYGGGPSGITASQHWGGGYGDCNSATVNSDSVFGGGGGAKGSPTSGGNTGGTSVFAGNGGASNTNGTFPAGGGGGGDNSFGGGDGANGLIRLTVYP